MRVRPAVAAVQRCGGREGERGQVATDDEINELIMRTEEELDMWQKMDQQRKESQAKDQTNKLPRLMQVLWKISASCRIVAPSPHPQPHSCLLLIDG